MLSLGSSGAQHDKIGTVTVWHCCYTDVKNTLSLALGISPAASNARKPAQLRVPSCPLWLVLFEDSSEKSITGMNAGNRPQKVAANQIVNVRPDQFSGLLQTEQLGPYRNDFEIGWVLLRT